MRQTGNLVLEYLAFRRPFQVVVCDETLLRASGNEYPTFAEAAAAAKLGGPGALLLQRGDATARGAIDLTGVAVVGLGTVTPTLTVADGCTFADELADYSFENVSLSFSGAAPVITVPVGATITLERYASITMGISASAPFISVEGGIVMDMAYSNSLTKIGGQVAISLGVAAYAQIRVGNFGIVGANTITGGSDGGLEVTDLSKAGGGAAATISNTQSGTTNPVFD